MILSLFIFTILTNGIVSIDLQTCEGNYLNISCNAFTRIIIESADYGRHNSSICPKAGLDKNTNCSANATNIVRNRCNGLSHCELLVSNALFTDPCYGTYKYLEVNYICIPVFAPVIPLPIRNFCGPNGKIINCSPRYFNGCEYCNRQQPWHPFLHGAPICSYCCACKPGYLTDVKSGKCILAKYCPQPGKECETNEVFSQCGAGCQRTCFNREPRCREKSCVAGYICAENFVRDPDTNRCIYPYQCPPILRF